MRFGDHFRHWTLLEHVNRPIKAHLATFAFRSSWSDGVDELETELFGDGGYLVRLHRVRLPVRSDTLCEVFHLFVGRYGLYLQNEDTLLGQLVVDFEEEHANTGVSPVQMNPLDYAETGISGCIIRHITRGDQKRVSLKKRNGS